MIFGKYKEKNQYLSNLTLSIQNDVISNYSLKQLVDAKSMRNNETLH